MALKARIFPTRFGARRPGPAVRWVPPGYGLLAEEPRVGFLGIHHFHPLPSRHFIIWDHSVKQYDAAHFYLSRITKPPFRPRRSNKSLQVACGPLSSTASPARQGGKKGRGKRAAGAPPPHPHRPRERGRQGPRARVPGPRVWPGRDTPLPGPRPSSASPWAQCESAFPSPLVTRPPRPHRLLNLCRSIYWEQTNSPFWKRFNCWLDGWDAAAGGRAGPRGARGKGLVGKWGAQRPSATRRGNPVCVRAWGRGPRVPQHSDRGRRRGLPEGWAPSGGGVGRSSASSPYTLSRPGKFAGGFLIPL